ncbi:hypothetical protein ABZ883_02980 [Streptomyces sp. NPDC046977]|uniref:hypothetical protein n=1 Tax=Streptomyces sp. NPDC046977 TaxID=3154703 RepID=UPI0033F21168
MNTHVDISLRGPHAGMDADDSLGAISALLRVVAELERMEVQKGARARMTRWTFKSLSLGSLTTTLEPLKVAKDSSFTIVDRVLAQMVNGFAVAEATEELPPSWTPRVAYFAADAARRLGASPDVGMRLALGGAEPVEVEVTQRAHQNLTRAMKARYTSFGSRRGHLGGLFDSTHGHIRAVLRSEVGNERIPLECPEALREDLRHAWGGDRVEVSGRISENARGQVVRIDVQEVEVLSTQCALSARDLTAGFWPDMTDGLSARDHLAVIRGEA